MKPDRDPVEPGIFAMRSLILPAAASALVGLGFSMGFSCNSGAGPWILLAAPCFAAVGAVGGPERHVSTRIWLALGSAALNLAVMVGVISIVSSASCI
jgi:hypothetical protein